MLKKKVLDNGVRIVTEYMPYVRSISMGIWVGAGSKNETGENNGISHFIEHMMFKGTKNRTAKQIAEVFDEIGGQINAFTGKECTCYYAKVLNTHAGTAFEVLSDMFFNSLFSDKDLEVEKRIVDEEISMYEDSPEDLVYDLFSSTIWENTSLGFPVLGNSQTVQSITRNSIHKYMEENYVPDNTVISIAGNFEYDNIIELVNKHFSQWKKKSDYNSDIQQVKFVSGYNVKNKDIEQIHMCMGFEGLKYNDPKLYSIFAINNILGGGMSSRLFQKIREEKGLVYSIYSHPTVFNNTGAFTIYVGTSPENLSKVIKLIKVEIQKFIKDKMTKNELSKAKEQLKSNYILSLESSSGRMNSIGKAEITQNRIMTSDQVLKKIEDISLENIDEVSKQIFDMDKLSVAVVGNLKSKLKL